MAPACRGWRKPSHRGEDPTQPKIKNINKIKIKSFEIIILKKTNKQTTMREETFKIEKE